MLENKFVASVGGETVIAELSINPDNLNLAVLKVGDVEITATIGSFSQSAGKLNDMRVKAVTAARSEK